MENNLLISLINRNIIKEGTKVLICRLGNGLDGNKNIKITQNVEIYQILIENKTVKLLTFDTITNSRYSLLSKHILEIDGMSPEMIGDLYGFKENGKKKKVKIDPVTGLEIKRGRKPKRRNL